MLEVNKNLSPKGICGKKYRSPAFLYSAIFSIPFFLFAVAVPFFLPAMEGRGVIVGLLIVIALALPVALLLSFRETVCILGEDKLYFFHSRVVRPKNEKRKQKSVVWTSGSVDYADIKEFRSLGMEKHGRSGESVITPHRIVIIGEDFEVEIYGFKSLIQKIKP